MKLNNDYKLNKLHTFTKVLVVEEVFYVKRSISKILTEAGYFVLTASSGVEGFEKFKKFSPDIITVGRKLPDMRGLDFIKGVREEHNGYKTKIIFISRKSEMKEMSLVLSDYINGLISTPIEKDELISSIGDLFLNLNPELSKKK